MSAVRSIAGAPGAGPDGAALFYEDLIAGYLDQPWTVARGWLSSAIRDRLRRPTCRFVLLVGEPGAGKTGLMAALARANPDWPRYFIRSDSTTPLSSGDAVSLFLRVGLQLAHRRPSIFDPQQLEIVVNQRIEHAGPGAAVVGVKIDDLKVSPFYRTAIRVQQNVQGLSGGLVGVEIAQASLEPRLLELDLLSHLALLDPAALLARQHPDDTIVVLVDALDELLALTGRSSVLDWLETGAALPPNIRVVLTSRLHDRLRTLQSIRGAELEIIEIDAESNEVTADARAFAVKLFDENTALAQRERADREQAVASLCRAANGNFAYLNAYARSLHAALEPGSAATLDELLTFDALPDGLNALYAAFIRRVRRQIEQIGQIEVASPTGPADNFVAPWEGVGQRFLAVLAVARAPLSLEQLIALGGVRAWKSAAGNVLGYFVPFLDVVDGDWRLFHASFGEFLTSADQKHFSDIAVDPSEWHTRIVRAYRNAFSRSWNNCDGYGVAFLLHHAIESGQSDETDHLMEDLGFLAVAEPDSVMRASSRARSDRADDHAAAYGRVANLLRGLSPKERRSVMEMSLLQGGIRRLGEAEIPDCQPRATWRSIWADCEPSVRHHSFGGHSEGISAISCGYLGSRPCVVTGDARGGVMLSDPLTGTKIGFVPDRRRFRITALAIYSRHEESVLVVGDAEGMVECWDLVQMKWLWGTNGYHWSVEGVAVGTLQGRTVVASCSSTGIYANDLRSGERVATFGGDSLDQHETKSAHCLALYEVGGKTMFVAGDGAGVVHLLDFEFETTTRQIKLDEAPIKKIEVLASSNGRRYIACAALGRAITILDGETFDVVSRVVDHCNPNHMPSIASGAVGSEPVVWSATGAGISAYSWPTARRVAEISVDRTDLYPIARMQTGDATTVLLGCAGRNVHAIDERESRRLRTDLLRAGSRVTAIAIIELSGDSFLACGHDDGSIRLRDPASGAVLPLREWRAPGTIRSIHSVECEGELILACCFDGGIWISHHQKSIVLANTEREDKVRSATLGLIEGRAFLAIGTDKGKVETYALGLTLAPLGAIESAHEWPSPNEADPRIFPSSISSLGMITEEGQELLVSVGWEDKTIKVWDWRTLRLRSIIPTRGYVMRLASVMVNTQSTLVSIGMDLRCQFWDPKTGVLLREHIDRRVQDTSYPYENETLWYVDMATGKIGDTDVVAVAARDGSVTVLDAESLAIVVTPSVGYGMWGQSIAFAPSGIIVLAGSRGLTAIKLPDADHKTNA